MQAPTYADLQIFKKVAAWLCIQADQLGTLLPYNPTMETDPRALAVFDHFPTGALKKPLIDKSRAFRRLAEGISAMDLPKQAEIEAWAQRGILATVTPTGALHLKRG